MDKTPESSDHTTVKLRAESVSKASQPNRKRQQPKGLLPFVGNPGIEMDDIKLVEIYNNGTHMQAAVQRSGLFILFFAGYLGCCMVGVIK